MGGLRVGCAVHRFTGDLIETQDFKTQDTRHKIMAEWVTLTVDDVLAGMTVRERDDFAKSSVGVTVPDRLEPILENMVAEIQGMIASRADNPTPPASDVIPAEFKRHAISLVRWDLLTSIPGYTPGDARKLAYQDANAFFMKVSEGKIRPRAQVASGAPAATPNSGTWNSENKIVGRMNPTPKPGMQGGGSGRYANDDAPADAG
jgi:hypothetical protein